MKENIDYGKIPGTSGKPTLLKPGAEKLCALFMLAPRFTREIIEHESAHREYRYTCELYHIPTDKFVGSGSGSCSTLESKYRYHWRDSGLPVPKEYWNTNDQSILQGGFPRKSGSGSTWTIQFRIENLDIPDKWNTVMKMAEKRALLSAILIVTGGSEVFTQDIEPTEPQEEKHISQTL